MATTPQHIASLLYGQLNGTLTAAQSAELVSWLGSPERSPVFSDDIGDEAAIARWVSEYESDLSAGREEIVLERVLSGIREGRQSTAGSEPVVRPVHRVHFLKTAWFRYAAAVLIIFGSGTVAYLWNHQEPVNTNKITSTQPSSHQNDIAPGGQKALLTLADGSTILLDSAANGQLATQQGSSVTKKDGQIIYNPLNSLNPLNPRSIVFNTMSTPRGGQYQLTLPDGTKAWLNAASSITYPTIFNGQNREVKITGEVYFEVAKNKEKPFIVNTVKESITVLGTSFNVNSYTDEPAGKITLIDGAVRVNEKILKPGQAYSNGKIVPTNTTQDIAWKNGLFDFNDLDFATSMRQLERWFDIKVIYDGNIPKGTFLGEIDRSLTLSQVIKLLDGVVVKFKLEGRELHVLK